MHCSQRVRAPEYQLRQWNNTVKRHLIAHAVNELRAEPGQTVSVLDLACGCGGDLGKFEAAVCLGARCNLVLHGVDYTKERIQVGVLRPPKPPGYSRFTQGARLWHAGGSFALCDE